MKNKVKYTVPVYNIAGEEVKKHSVFFDDKITEKNYNLLNQYIYVYLINQRSGNAHTKTRSEIRGTTKKAYRQKGTGRARHGSEKAPIFVGGGVCGGPRAKYHNASINKKQKRLALIKSIQDKFEQKLFYFLDNSISDMEIKTKSVFNFLRSIGIDNKSSLLLFSNGKEIPLHYSSRNIKNVTTSSIDSINPYIILNSNAVVCLDDNFEKLKSIIEKNESI